MKARVAFPLALLLIALAVAGLVAWALHVADRRVGAESERLENAARDVGAFFADTFNARPQVIVNERVFIEQARDAAELATVVRDTRVEREMTHAWLGSKKRIRIQAVYAVKAGFDLGDNFSVRVTEKRIDVQLPPPRILSVEQKDISVEALESGLWNKIGPQELEAELAALPALARQKAGEAGLHADARRVLLEKLQARFGETWEIHLDSDGPAQ